MRKTDGARTCTSCDSPLAPSSPSSIKLCKMCWMVRVRLEAYEEGYEDGYKAGVKHTKAALETIRVEAFEQGRMLGRGEAAGWQAQPPAPGALSDDVILNLLKLCHPDRNPPERQELAHKMTVMLNGLRRR